MAETHATPPPPAEMHWGIVYLREDIQDLRTEIRSLHARLDGLRSDTAARFDGLRAEMAAQIGGLRTEMTGQIDGLRSDTTAQYGGLRAEMTGQVGSLRSDTSNRFYWLIGTVLASWISLAGLVVLK